MVGAVPPSVASSVTETEKNRILNLPVPCAIHGVGPCSDRSSEIDSSSLAARLDRDTAVDVRVDVDGDDLDEDVEAELAHDREVATLKSSSSLAPNCTVVGGDREVRAQRDARVVLEQATPTSAASAAAAGARPGGRSGWKPPTEATKSGSGPQQTRSAMSPSRLSLKSS